MPVHERGDVITSPLNGNGARVLQPDGTALPAGSARTCRDERQDPDQAIYVCLANARTREERQQQRGETRHRSRSGKTIYTFGRLTAAAEAVIVKVRLDRNRCDVHAR